MPYIQLKGEILSFETFGEGRQRRLVGHFSDGTGVIDLVWFQGIKYLLEHYKTRTEYIVFGKPTVFNGRINVAHPDMDPSGELTLSAMGLQPYYNTTERMKRGFLNSHGLREADEECTCFIAGTSCGDVKSANYRRTSLDVVG